jgi:hypothetical protein
MDSSIDCQRGISSGLPPIPAMIEGVFVACPRLVSTKLKRR